MRSADPMTNPYFANILFFIESAIVSADRKAAQENVPFTDSQVRSILLRVRKAGGGSAPSMPRGTPREQAQAALCDQLLALRDGENSWGRAPRELPLQDWALSLRTLEDSIRLRSDGAGSRAYLEFIAGFVDGAKGELGDEILEPGPEVPISQRFIGEDDAQGFLLSYQQLLCTAARRDAHSLEDFIECREFFFSDAALRAHPPTDDADLLAALKTAQYGLFIIARHLAEWTEVFGPDGEIYRIKSITSDLADILEPWSAVRTVVMNYRGLWIPDGLFILKPEKVDAERRREIEARLD